MLLFRRGAEENRSRGNNGCLPHIGHRHCICPFQTRIHTRFINPVIILKGCLKRRTYHFIGGIGIGGSTISDAGRHLNIIERILGIPSIAYRCRTGQTIDSTHIDTIFRINQTIHKTRSFTIERYDFSRIHTILENIIRIRVLIIFFILANTIGDTISTPCRNTPHIDGSVNGIADVSSNTIRLLSSSSRGNVSRIHTISKGSHIITHTHCTSIIRGNISFVEKKFKCAVVLIDTRNTSHKSSSLHISRIVTILDCCSG